MFGYVTVDGRALTKPQIARYRACYCGLCRALQARYGNFSRLTLSYDMTFLYILLTSLYEPEEALHAARCPVHPLRSSPYMRNDIADYAADMNIILCWHKLQDNRRDDKSRASARMLHRLSGAYEECKARYPDKIARIGQAADEVEKLEKANASADMLANVTARMLGEVYAYQPDQWQDDLRQVGEALGRFIYLMDAYDDLPRDIRRNRFNPLRARRDAPDFEDFCRDSLKLLMGECSLAFERLPLVQDVDILRNVLYSGIWRKYTLRRKRAKGAEQ